MSHRFTAIVAAMLCSLSLPASATLTPVQTVSFLGGENSNNGTFGDTDINASYSAALTGFQKFNPSLGTLDAVLLTIQTDARVVIEISTSQLIDDGENFSVQLSDTGSKTFLQNNIAYNHPNGTRFVVIESTSHNTVGGADLNPDDFGGSGNFSYTDSTEKVYGGFSGGGSTAKSGSISSTDSFYDADDFVGVGLVDALSVRNFANLDVLLGDTAVLDNIDPFDVDVMVTARVESGDVTLQYDYTVPEPLSLVGFAALVPLMCRRGRG